MSNNDVLQKLEKQIKEAREHGALYHPTNPADAWFCKNCGVFGKEGNVCWCCDSASIEWRWVPRFGGGAETVVREPEN